MWVERTVSQKLKSCTMPWLEISIDGCRIWPLAGKIGQKSLNVVSGLKIDGCMHPLPQIDGCSCTLRTCTNQGPAMPIWQPFYALFCPNLSFWCNADLMILKQSKSFAIKKERWFWRLFLPLHCALPAIAPKLQLLKPNWSESRYEDGEYLT